MKSSDKLKTFGEVKEEAKEMYVPGTMVLPHNPLPSITDEFDSAIRPMTLYYPEWKRPPSRVTGIPGDVLARFKYGKGFRQWAKGKTYRSLRMIPSYHQQGVEAEADIVIKGEGQPPFYFLDGVPDYDEAAFGLGQAASDQSGMVVSRGSWGELIPAISDIAKMYFETETARYRLPGQAGVQPQPQIQTQAASMSWIIPIGLVGLLFFTSTKKISSKKRRKIR